MSTSTNKPTVWIATPLRHFDADGPVDCDLLLDKLEPHYANPIRELRSSPDLPWDIQLVIVGGGGVARCRNRVVSEFMVTAKNPEDQILFVDYDLIPDAGNYVSVLSSDISILGALYTTRADNGHWVLNKLSWARPNANGILPVMELGTGFKRYKKRALDKVLQDNPWIDCESDFDHRKRELGFFSMGPVHDAKLWPGRHRWLTEDYWLDWLCRESGFAICVDTKIQLRHYDEDKKKIFPLVFPPNPGDLPPENKEP